MAVAFTRVTSVQLTDFVCEDFGFYSGSTSDARTRRRRSDRPTREKRRRTAFN